MKKTYMTPATEVTKLELQTIIAASPTAGGNVYTETEAEEGVSGFSRRGSIWDDEE